MEPCNSCGKSPKAILNKVVNIIEGNFNRIVKDPDIELMARERLSKCYECSFKILLVTMGSTKVYACGKCGDYLKCPIESKTRAENEVCPVNKW